MKKLSVLCICNILLSCAFAQKATLETSVQEMNLKGKVKSVREILYGAVWQDSLPVKTGIRVYGQNTLYEFDESGNEVSQTNYTPGGNVKNYIRTKYREPGLKTERVDYDSNYNVLSKKLYEYNEDNQETKITEYDGAGKMTYLSIFQYTDNLNYTVVTTDQNGDTTVIVTGSFTKDNKLLYKHSSQKWLNIKYGWKYNADKQNVQYTIETPTGAY